MSETATPQVWPGDLLSIVALLVLLICVVLDLGRNAGRGLGVAVGAIRLRPPTFVPLTDAETANATQLLAGVIADYLAATDGDADS